MIAPHLPPGFHPVGALGRGGTAEVIRATCPALGRDVALKIPLPPADQTDSTPFATLVAREQLLVGGRRFPGLVRLLGASTDPAYVAMEICAGPTLDTLGRIDNLPLSLNLLSALAVNLEYLRAIGVVHGDLKPHNVFLPIDWSSQTDSRPFRVKLSDFSLGKRAEETQDCRVGLGTVGYMPPETIVDGTADHRSDLFAYGVIAYQMLTGVHPFMNGETDPAAISSRCREEEPPRITELRPEAGDELADLVARLLSKDPTDRPRSGWDVCRELETIGAQYPFRAALSPVHLLPPAATIEDAFKLTPVEWQGYEEYLSDISLQSPSWLRMILAIAFRRASLIYDGDRFKFIERPTWPSRIRREALRVFSALPTARRKRLVRAAIRTERGDCSAPADAAITMLLRPFLRTSTVRRLSAAMAPAAERDEQFRTATVLALQSGDLPRAERCCFQAASRHQKENQHQPALRLIGSVLDYAGLLGRSFEVVGLVKIKGDILKNAGEIESAHHAYGRVIELYRDRQPDLLLGKTYNAIGDLFKLKQRFSEGIAALHEAQRIYETTDNELELSHTFNNIGNMQYIAGDRSEALRQYRRALRVQRRLSAHAEVASTLNNIGATACALGRLQRGARLLTVSLKLKREQGEIIEIARTLNNLGYLYHLLGKRRESIEACSEALELNRRIGNRKELLFNLDNLSATTISSGDLRGSLIYLREGTELSREIADTPHRMMFHRNTSTVLRRMGRLGEAMQQHDAAAALISEVDDREEEVRLVVSAASLRAAVGDLLEAERLATDAAALAETYRCKPEKLNALLLLTRMTDNPSLHEESRTLAVELGLLREGLIVQANWLESLVRRKEIAAVAESLPEIGKGILALDDDLELPRLLLVLAHARIVAGEEIGATELIQRAVTLADRCGLTPEKALGLTWRGNSLRAQGNYEEAFAACSQSLRMVKGIAESIPDAADRHLFQQTPLVQMLVGQIKDLQARIGQKKGAGL